MFKETADFSAVGGDFGCSGCCCVGGDFGCSGCCACGCFNQK